MVEPFSEPFVKEYVGNDVIEQYKQAYNSLISFNK